MNTAISRVNTRFQDYASYHRTPCNQATHMVGIPLIVLSILGLLSHWVIGDGMTGSEYVRLDGGMMLWAASMLWYLYLNWKLALPFSLVTLGLYFVGRTFTVPILWGLFIAGWAIQYVGHYVYEKKSPAFYKNGEHLLIGPFWVFAKMVGFKRQ